MYFFCGWKIKCQKREGAKVPFLARFQVWRFSCFCLIFIHFPKKKLPSLKLTVRPWNPPCFLVNTIKMVDFPASYVSFREGKPNQSLQSEKKKPLLKKTPSLAVFVRWGAETDDCRDQEGGESHHNPRSSKFNVGLSFPWSWRWVLHPWKLTWLAGKSPFSIVNTSSNGKLM